MAFEKFGKVKLIFKSAYIAEQKGTRFTALCCFRETEERNMGIAEHACSGYHRYSWYRSSPLQLLVQHDVCGTSPRT